MSTTSSHAAAPSAPFATETQSFVLPSYTSAAGPEITSISWRALSDALNGTQQGFVFETVHQATISSVVPIVLLESFCLGALTVGLVLGSDLAWGRRLSRRLLVLGLWLAYGGYLAQWALLLRFLRRSFSGRLLGLSSDDWYGVYWDARNDPDTLYHLPVYQAWYYYTSSLGYLEPLITETVLFGVTSALFGCMLYASRGAIRSRISSNVFIPAVATFMTATSLVHWSISLAQYWIAASWGAASLFTVGGPSQSFDSAPSIVLLIMFSINTILSDTIVLWRTYIVWDKSRCILLFAAALVFTTTSMILANIVALASSLDTLLTYFDEERVATFGKTQFGIAALYLSLASNLCATILVAARVWLYRRQLVAHARETNKRTFVERFMELLIDSGTAYTLLWIFYIVSVYVYIPAGSIMTPTYEVITLVDHLDTAMAQVTTIYPLLIFILVALDKTHSVQGPRLLRERVGTNGALTLTFDVGRDAEKDAMLDLGTHGLVQLPDKQNELEIPDEPPTYKGSDVW
ncbi:unnamed protein product [Peniophora sp. CBMAI 1063]|nr:unnamed protein product [Peniophora sp. CBMAI 1063]